MYNLHHVIKYRSVHGHKLALKLNLVLDLTCPKLKPNPKPKPNLP